MTEPAAPKLILASASPRRLDLLHQINLTPAAVVPADLDETPRRDELPRQLALRLAEAKTRAVAAHYPTDFVLGADTVVACGRRILGKAETEAEAAKFLALLSGRRHKVMSGICVVAPSQKMALRVVITAVIFKSLTKGEIARYLAGNEWRGKAGAYAIQGDAARFVRQIDGSYSNVVGLPLFEAAQLLGGLGFPV